MKEESHDVTALLSNGRGVGGEAEEWYLKGNEYRRQSLWHEAINCYIKAIELDPESPAVEAKQMLDDILSFYCKDMYNP